MRDFVSIKRVQQLHPKIRQEIQDLIEQAEERLGIKCAIRVVQGGRTFPEQDVLYAQGRTNKKLPKVTNSKAGQSYHNYFLAIDIALLYDKDGNGAYETVSWDILKDFDKDGIADWMEVVDLFEEAGYTWGGRFNSIKDNPHFEKTFGLHWKEMLRRYNIKYFIPDTEYIYI